MNDEEKNVMTIVTISRIVESSLWYCLPPRSANGFSKEERANRLQALTVLTSEGSPFFANCERNGDAGKELFDDMHYFIEDVYGDPGRIVTVDINGVVHVEPSLVIELFTTITKLRAYLEAFISSAMKFLAEKNSLSKDFEDLVNTDIRYYHAFGGKISCILISNKFIELNQTADVYVDSYSKSHNGIDPKQDPEFNVRNDPSFRMVENEFHELNQDMVTVLNSYGEKDPDFRFAREQVYADCDIFTGKKTTTNTQAYFAMFTSYFDKILSATQNRLNDMFAAMSMQMAAADQQPAAAPVPDGKPADKPEEAMKPVAETKTETIVDEPKKN